MAKNSTTKLIKLFSREYSVQYTEQSLRCLDRETQSLLPALLTSQVYIPENSNEMCCAEPTEWQNFLLALSTTYGAPKDAETFIGAFHFYGKKYVAIAHQVARGVAVASPKELAKRYQGYQKALTKYSAYLWMGYFLNNWYADQAKKLLVTKNIVDSASVAAVLSPDKHASILALSDILFKIKKQGRGLTAVAAKRILKKYAWMSCLDVHNDPWTESELHALYEGLSLPKKIPTFMSVVRGAQFSATEKAFLSTMRSMVYVKDMRDEYRRQGVFASLPLFEAMAKVLRVSRIDLAFCTEAEILNALSEKSFLPSNAEITRRRSGFLIYRKAGKMVVSSDPTTIAKYIADHIVQAVVATELKGTVASRGVVKGRVAIVRGIKDLFKVKRGDIMVAVTTHPDFVPAMQRAAAILTDEGGLTSHAAIVSREMKKPCIVGTKVATQVLKDGDRVEVDAEKGIVIKI